jgi:glycine/D-amino acid oxidase-like deaminating enzyme
LWRDTTDLPSFPRLNGNHHTDVAVVGGGITGITTAYLLSQAGYKVTLLEAGTLLNGTTGFTSAKITSQHGLIYHDLIQHFGKEQARLYYQGNTEAMDWMLRTAKKLNLSCGMTREDAYLYADAGDDKTLKQLQKEFEAYRMLGLPGEWQDRVSLPLQAQGAIKLPGQARFHPLQYLQGLLKVFLENGGVVYEHTMISEKVEKDGGLTLITEQEEYRITCRHAVSASHFPFYDGGALYFSRLHAERSYCLAIQPEMEFEGGMYLSAGQPTRSLRAVEWEGRKLVIVGGDNHKTGQGICTFGHYENLEKFAGQLLGIKVMPYRWSAQDLITLDRVPYIGKVSGDEEIYIATGFGKWGMTSGTLAALMISDQIQRKDNPYSKLFNPSRFKANPGIKNFMCRTPMWPRSLSLARWRSYTRRPGILSGTKVPLFFMTANASEPTETWKATFIWWTGHVHTWAANANGITENGPGIAPAMALATPMTVPYWRDRPHCHWTPSARAIG